MVGEVWGRMLALGIYYFLLSPSSRWLYRLLEWPDEDNPLQAGDLNQQPM